MRVFVMMGRRPAPVPKSVMAATLEVLRSRGCTVQVGYEEGLYQLEALPEADVYLVKSRSAFWVTLCTSLHYQGKRLINSFDAIQKTSNKIVTMALLAHENVLTPRSWLTSSERALDPLLCEGGLLVKPRYGHCGVGIRWLRNRQDLEELVLGEEPHLIQRLLQVKGPDVKLYGIGENIFCFRKHFGPSDQGGTGKLVEPSEELKQIALCCRRALGLSLFGVDVVETEAGPFVVDVNLYPGFRGISEAPEMVADVIMGGA